MDFQTVKYDTNGVRQWVATSVGGIDEGLFSYAVTADRAGNVYVAGQSGSPDGDQQVTIKYNPDGTERWRLTDPAAPDNTFLTSIALSSNNDVYVAGQSSESNRSTAILLEKIAESATPSVTTLTSAPNPSGTGQTVQLAATVTGSAPRGSVLFAEGQNIVAGCAAVTLVGAKATCATGALAAGSRLFTATYSGDENNAISTSQVLVQTVLPATTTTLVSSINPSAFGQAVSFTATVIGNRPTGSVDVRDGSTPICTGVTVSGPKGNTKSATCTTANLAAGSHSITATYSGDSTNASSISPPLAEVVNPPPPGVSLASSLNPSKPGASVTFTATVTGQGPTGAVTFKDGTTALCSAVPLQGGGDSPVATCTTATLTKGSHSITAAYSGDANNVASTSPILTQTIKRSKR
jgi:Big-like domain-containing protein